MTTLAVDPTQERLAELADEYRQQGYEVLLSPGAEDLPKFLHGYQLDLVARKDGRSIVVEVKTRKVLARDAQLRDLAQVLKETDGWQLSLVLVGNGEDEFAPQNSLNEVEVLQSLNEAHALLGSGYTNAAMLLAWSSTEAVLRLLGGKEDPPIVYTNPQHLLQALVMEGVISREEYEFLRQAMQDRNAIAHGYKSSYNAAKIVQKLIDTTRRLMNDAQSPSS